MQFAGLHSHLAPTNGLARRSACFRWHDSCGCLAAQAERFRRIIREQFVKMYEDHDVLQEVLDWARKDLAENAKGLLGKPPMNGSLNVKEVLEAEYAFA